VPPPRVLVDLAALARVPDSRDPDALALPTLGRLARESRFQFCTYDEFGPQPATWRGTWRGALGEVPVETIAPAVARSALGEDVFRDSLQSGALARLCAKLKLRDGAADASPTDAAEGGPAMPDVERFARLAARVQGHHLADLFHLWSGELAGCSYWMTVDGTLETLLRDRVQPYADPPLSCDVVRPAQLLQVLGVREYDPRPDDARRVVPIRPHPAA
jgi:hypothetical protein